MTVEQPDLSVVEDGHRAVVDELITRLQRGLDAGDGDVYDSMFSGDVLWGTPKGQVLQGYSSLNSIHRRMMAEAPTSTFELAQISSPSPDIIVAQIHRRAVDGGFSEMAMYVLVARDDAWWMVAGQNTPIVDTLPS